MDSNRHLFNRDFFTFSLFLIALAFSLPAAAALESFSFTFEPTSPLIYPDQAAYFKLTVTNNQNTPDAFIVSTDDFDWILDTTALLSDVPPGASQFTFVQLSPKSDITPGVKLVRIRVRSANTREVGNTVAEVAVRAYSNATSQQYAPSIFLSARAPETVDPREPVTVSVYLRNRNARDYPNLTVRVQSDLFYREYVTMLGSINGEDGEKTNQLQVQIDPATAPGQYSMRITILAGDFTVNTYEAAFNVQGYVDEVRSTELASAFFKTTTRYTLRNDGNVPDTLTFQHPTTFIKRLFTDADAESTVAQGGKALIFTSQLAPGESITVEIVENFRLLVILGIVIVVSIIAYFVFRSPVVVRKEAQIRAGDADGVSELRIRLHVKSRGARSVHNLHVVDRITSMADVVKETALGTLQPTKIVKKPNHGTLIRWDLDTLEPFEERIISYSVKTKLKLIGDVYLPAAKVKFDQNGRERTAYSNEVNIPREG